VSSHHASLRQRVAGVIRRPRATFETVAREPQAADVLTIAFLVTAAALGLLLETETGRFALIDQWERTAVAFGQTIGDAEYEAMEAMSESGLVYAAVTSLLSGPVLAIVVAIIGFALFRALHWGNTTYRQLLAIVAHANVILALRHLIVAPTTYIRESLASPLTLALFFPMLHEASLVARCLAIIDLFVVWWIVVLALGMSVLSGRSARCITASLIGIYGLLALLLAAAMALTGGTV
jgi:hypothetical protein